MWDKSRRNSIPLSLQTKRISAIFGYPHLRLSSCFLCSYPLIKVYLETVGVVIPLVVAGPGAENAVVGIAVLPGVVGPGVENAVVGIAVLPGVDEPGVDVVAVVFDALSVADAAEPLAFFDIPPAVAV